VGGVGGRYKAIMRCIMGIMCYMHASW
jgi:hypothetical protein